MHSSLSPTRASALLHCVNEKGVTFEKVLQMEMVEESNMLINHGASDNNVENSNANCVRLIGVIFITLLLSPSHSTHVLFTLCSTIN